MVGRRLKTKMTTVTSQTNRSKEGCVRPTTDDDVGEGVVKYTTQVIEILL